MPNWDIRRLRGLLVAQKNKWFRMWWAFARGFSRKGEMLTKKDIEDLNAYLGARKNRTAGDNANRRPLEELVNEAVGEPYAQKLAAMTEAEAIIHLRSVSGKKLSCAYMLFSVRPHFALKANHPVLAEVCLRLMGSPYEHERVFSASGIGIWLQGTRDRNASRALALMISNNDEKDAVKSEAYKSLELINNKKTALDIARKAWQTRGEPIDPLPANDFDWDFVNSFLAEKGDIVN